MSHPGYEYGLSQAVRLAQALGIGAISACELGVAGGNGLLALEGMARKQPVDVAVTGFDTGTGMPEPVDYRDLPYVWPGGSFVMDEAALRARLTGAELVIGDVASTIPDWMAADRPPLGFVAFDLDCYTSTANAMWRLLTGPVERYLPRVLCFFDDTVGPEEEMHSEFAGELLAIAEFNAAHSGRKLAQPHGLRWKTGDAGVWVEGIYVLHLFSHPRYGDYIYGGRDRSRELRLG